MCFIAGTAQDEADTPVYRTRNEGQKAQENKTSSTHVGWTQHRKRESSRLRCAHDQLLLKVIVAGDIWRILECRDVELWCRNLLQRPG